MKKELGIARCGLACCLCSENGRCGGCDSGDCPGAGNCENRACSISRRLRHCYECPDVENCRKGKLSDPRIYGFTHFARVYGENYLLACLARNEEAGIRYHRQGLKRGITTVFRIPVRWSGLSGAGKVHKAARLDSFFLSRRRINKKGQPSTSCPFKIHCLQSRLFLFFALV